EEEVMVLSSPPGLPGLFRARGGDRVSRLVRGGAGHQAWGEPGGAEGEHGREPAVFARRGVVRSGGRSSRADASADESVRDAGRRIRWTTSLTFSIRNSKSS